MQRIYEMPDTDCSLTKDVAELLDSKDHWDFCRHNLLVITPTQAVGRQGVALVALGAEPCFDPERNRPAPDTQSLKDLLAVYDDLVQQLEAEEPLLYAVWAMGGSLGDALEAVQNLHYGDRVAGITSAMDNSDIPGLSGLSYSTDTRSGAALQRLAQADSGQLLFGDFGEVLDEGGSYIRTGDPSAVSPLQHWQLVQQLYEQHRSDQLEKLTTYRQRLLQWKEQSTQGYSRLADAYQQALDAQRSEQDEEQEQVLQAHKSQLERRLFG